MSEHAACQKRISADYETILRLETQLAEKTREVEELSSQVHIKETQRTCGVFLLDQTKAELVEKTAALQQREEEIALCDDSLRNSMNTNLALRTLLYQWESWLAQEFADGTSLSNAPPTRETREALKGVT